MAQKNVLGSNLKAIRLKKKLKQRVVAYIADVQPANLSRYENGKKTPNLATLARLAKALGTTPSKLLAA